MQIELDAPFFIIKHSKILHSEGRIPSEIFEVWGVPEKYGDLFERSHVFSTLIRTFEGKDRKVIARKCQKWLDQNFEDTTVIWIEKSSELHTIVAYNGEKI